MGASIPLEGTCYPVVDRPLFFLVWGAEKRGSGDNPLPDIIIIIDLDRMAISTRR